MEGGIRKGEGVQGGGRAADGGVTFSFSGVGGGGAGEGVVVTLRGCRESGGAVDGSGGGGSEVLAELAIL